MIFFWCRGSVTDCTKPRSYQPPRFLLWRKIRYGDKKGLTFRDPIFLPFIAAEPIIVWMMNFITSEKESTQ